jgi:hypothetical protein
MEYTYLPKEKIAKPFIATAAQEDVDRRTTRTGGHKLCIDIMFGDDSSANSASAKFNSTGQGTLDIRRVIRIGVNDSLHACFDGCGYLITRGVSHAQV